HHADRRHDREPELRADGPAVVAVSSLRTRAPEAADIATILRRALAQTGCEMRDAGCVSREGVDLLVEHAQGDARRALNTLEAVLQHVHASRIPHPASRDVVVSVLERPLPAYDKSVEQHFNLISALHKAVRGPHVEASLYCLARLPAGGEGLLS